MIPTLTDRSPLAGCIPMERHWWDCGNGYGVSAVILPDCEAPLWQVAAGLWMDRRPGWLRRLFRRTEVLHTTDERVHVATWAGVLALVGHVAELPPLGSVEPPRRLLPDCGCPWCLL